MSLLKEIKLPPLPPAQNQSQQNDTVRTQEGKSTGAVTVRKLCWTSSSYIYAGRGRKPQLLTHLESYVNRELHMISSSEPKFQELKLQVYRDVFGCFIKEFKTYQPLLSAIKKEYENTLAYQQDQIHELEPLRSNLRRLTEECDRKVQARQAEEHADIRALKRENQLLQEGLKAMKEKEKAMQTVVDHLQSELSQQYLQYREERDARRLLILQLNDLTRGSVKEEHPADGNTEATDCVALQLALKVCREDLTKAQEELSRMKAEYWDVVPRCNWDSMEQTHKHTILQLERLQADFDQLKSEYDTLLEPHSRSNTKNKTHDPITVQMDESGEDKGQSHSHSNSDVPESSILTVQEFREALRTAFPLKSEQEIDELVASAQREADSSIDSIPSQRLRSLLEESRVATLLPAPDQSEDNAASNHPPARK